MAIELVEQRDRLLFDSGFDTERPRAVTARAGAILHRFKERMIFVPGRSELPNPARSRAVEHKPDFVPRCLELLRRSAWR